VRLKARPLVDIISHALMLSTFLFLIPYYIYRDDLGSVWVLAVGTFLISANGQFYNQVRDYDADEAAGLHNTASVLGKTATNILAQLSVVGFVVSIVAAALLGAFPLWLGPVFLVATAVVMLVMRNNHTDMRGSETDDPVGQLQVQFLTIFNVTLLVWLAVAYLS
jgi:1,4-dihydroxy-2-naphthoate octaprenyltransferase